MKFTCIYNAAVKLKKYFPAVIFLIGSFTSYLLFGQAANHIVISEVAPMGGASSSYNTGEFIELYNPLPTDVTFGENVVITSGEASGSNSAAWTLSLAGKTIKAYGFLLIGDGGTAVTPDAAFPNNKNLANSGTRSYVQLKDGTTVIDAFGWDPSNVFSPNCEGTAFHPSSTASDKKSFERKSGSTATAHDTLGNAWDSNNNSVDFFENISANANPQNSSSPIAKNPYNIPLTNGPGSVTVSPSMWKFDAGTTLTFVVKSLNDTTRGLKLVKPDLFSWDAGSITVQPDTVFFTPLLADTIMFGNFILTGSDSIVITIQDVTAADTTDEFSFSILTSANETTFLPLKTAPRTLVYGLPRPASVIKAKETNGVYTQLGKWVVAKGVVTVANEFGGPSYLQDNSAGFAIYDSSVSNNVERGDEIIVLGKVSPFYDLFELTPASILEATGEGIAYDTLTLTTLQIKSQNPNGIEPYEARLIRVNNIEKVLTTNNTPASTWAVTGSGTNYNLVSGSDTIQVRISPRINLVNLPVPSGKFDIVGVLGQYKNTYQLMPRSYEDIIIEGAGPIIVSGIPYESSITSDSITFNFKTNIPGTSIIKFGKTTEYGNIVSDTNKVTNHQITISGLEPAQIYHVQIGTSNNGDTTYTSDYVTETSSLTSTGTMNVYFNHSIDNSVSAGEDAAVVDISEQFFRRLSFAKYSIDLALYSLSGTVGLGIVNALVGAKNRGVKVRVIGEYDNRETAAWSNLSSSGISVIFDNFDAANAGAGFMHNKFAVIDNRDTTDDTDDWVWTGSWNATDPGNSNDAQNVIEIQDKALANAYRLEFEEMWGSNSDTPDSANSRFGARKTNNTPHVFNIAGTHVELYFDPSDHTTFHLADAMNASVSSINVAMLTLTRNDLAQILVNKKNAGEKVHVVLDNNIDAGNQFNYLKNNGVDILLKGDAIKGYLHHKYAVIDADITSADQVVITGSHNWSTAAENSNNENTLIIHDNRIANLYLQEFKARYLEAGGMDIITGIEKQSDNEKPADFSLSQNYPNPFNPTTTILFSLPVYSYVVIKVYDILGREIATLVNEEKAPGSYEVKFNAHSNGGNNLASGIYFYRITAGSFTATKKFVLLK